MHTWARVGTLALGKIFPGAIYVCIHTSQWKHYWIRVMCKIRYFKNLEWFQETTDTIYIVYIFFVFVLLLTSVWLFATPWTVAWQAPLSMGFSRQENTGVGCHFLLQGIFPTQGSNPCFLYSQADSLPLGHQGSGTLYNKCQITRW